MSTIEQLQKQLQEEIRIKDEVRLSHFFLEGFLASSFLADYREDPKASSIKASIKRAIRPRHLIIPIFVHLK